MRQVYQGFEVSAVRDKSTGGIQIDVIHESNGLVVMSGLSQSEHTILQMIHFLIEVVDDFLIDPQAYVRTIPTGEVIDADEENEGIEEVADDNRRDQESAG